MIVFFFSSIESTQSISTSNFMWWYYCQNSILSDISVPLNRYKCMQTMSFTRIYANSTQPMQVS